jgi:hypothetical protein
MVLSLGSSIAPWRWVKDAAAGLDQLALRATRSVLFKTAQEIGLKIGIVKKVTPLECTGTQFYQICG